MHYRAIDWLPEVVSYPELVAGYQQTGLLLRRAAGVAALAVVLVALGFLWTPLAWTGAVVLVVAAWLAFPRTLVRLRYRADIRPPFVEGEYGS